MTSPSARLTDLGLALPPVVAPVAAYVPAVRAGSFVYSSGQVPMVDGALLATGLLGESVSVEDGQRCARACALNALAAVSGVVPLDQVRVIKVVGFVASAPGFTQQPLVVNGASELLQDVFGSPHARSAVGVAALPLGAPVEVELIAEIVQ